MKDDRHDPRGLIASAFEIEGISLEECRTIFLDWAISVPHHDLKASAAFLAERFADRDKDHPMQSVLAEAQHPPRTGRRRRKH